MEIKSIYSVLNIKNPNVMAKTNKKLKTVLKKASKKVVKNTTVTMEDNRELFSYCLSQALYEDYCKTIADITGDRFFDVKGRVDALIEKHMRQNKKKKKN